MKKFITLLAFILLGPSLLLNINYYFNSRQDKSGIMVVEVLDGDTVLLDGKVKLRLRHVDAPEIGFCAGSEAKKELIKLARNKRVRIEEQILDNWGRPMGLVYIGDVLINQKMLESGWVRYHSDKTTRADELSKIGNEVKTAKKGIFSTLCRQTENTDKPSCNIKGNIDPQGGIKRYYYPGCAQYPFAIVEKDLGEKWFCTTSEAEKDGYVKAATCK